MLRTRVIVVVILLPIGLAIIYLGGWPFTAFVALILGLAAWEYSQIFRGSKLEQRDQQVARADKEVITSHEFLISL